LGLTGTGGGGTPMGPSRSTTKERWSELRAANSASSAPDDEDDEMALVLGSMASGSCTKVSGPSIFCV